MPIYTRTLHSLHLPEYGNTCRGSLSPIIQKEAPILGAFFLSEPNPVEDVTCG